MDADVDRCQGHLSSRRSAVGELRSYPRLLRQLAVRDPPDLRGADVLLAPRLRHQVRAGGWEGYLEPENKNKKAFRKRISAILNTKHSQTVGSAEGLLVRPLAIYTLIRRVLEGDVEKPEIPFSALGGPTTLHFLATMPNDIVEKLLLEVIRREATLSEVNLKAKRVRALAFAREHIARYCKKKYPVETEGLTDWDHFTKLWPTLEQLADNSEGYWANQKGKAKAKDLPALDEMVDARIRAYKEAKEGKGGQPVAADRSAIPFLTASVHEEKVVVLKFQNLQYVLLNCSTEAASKWLKAHEFGQSSPSLFVCLVCLYLLCCCCFSCDLSRIWLFLFCSLVSCPFG